MTSTVPIQLSFVTCASSLEVLGARLLASPCLRQGGHALAAHFNATSAAQGFNTTLAATDASNPASWLVWAHQDVFLPEGWDRCFQLALEAALLQFPKLAVAGVYGIAGTGTETRRAGHVLDRGTLLQEATALPCQVDSLDELLFAVRLDSGLQLDPALGFDFYATDLVLQAQARGWQCAVLDAYCEHWADTPANGAISLSLAQRIQRSAAVFERKWAGRLPLSTPCFEINRVGDVAALIASIGVARA